LTFSWHEKSLNSVALSEAVDLNKRVIIKRWFYLWIGFRLFVAGRIQAVRRQEEIRSRLTKEQHMAEKRNYKVYILVGGHVASPPAEINCGEDALAIETARELAEGRHVELWDGARQVAALNAD